MADNGGMDSTVLNKLRNAAEEVFAGTSIFLAYAHGSRVHGSPRATSDLDIGYYIEKSSPRADLPLHEELALEGELTALMGCEVDLRHLGAAPLEARGRVLEQGIRIYCSNESARVALETALLARYHDYKPAFAAMHTERLATFAGSK